MGSSSTSTFSAAFWPSVIAAAVVLTTTAIGIVFHLGMTWHFLGDGITAAALLAVIWTLQRQRQHLAETATAKIEHLRGLLRSATAASSTADLKAIEMELERLQIELR